MEGTHDLLSKSFSMPKSGYDVESTHKFSMESTHEFSMESTHKFSIATIRLNRCKMKLDDESEIFAWRRQHG